MEPQRSKYLLLKNSRIQNCKIPQDSIREAYLAAKRELKEAQERLKANQIANARQKQIKQVIIKMSVNPVILWA